MSMSHTRTMPGSQTASVPRPSVPTPAGGRLGDSPRFPLIVCVSDEEEIQHVREALVVHPSGQACRGGLSRRSSSTDGGWAEWPGITR
jgi:hypothetical protein